LKDAERTNFQTTLSLLETLQIPKEGAQRQVHIAEARFDKENSLPSLRLNNMKNSMRDRFTEMSNLKISIPAI